MGRKLYVGNLPYSAAEQDLQELFEQVGPGGISHRHARHGDWTGAWLRFRRNGDG